jgi:hypothetical protein
MCGSVVLDVCQSIYDKLKPRAATLFTIRYEFDIQECYSCRYFVCNKIVTCFVSLLYFSPVNF